MTSLASTLGYERVTGGLPDLLAHVGGTPLLQLRRIAGGLRPGVELHAKAEHLNPSGSLKDRPAKAMILAAAAAGLLTPDKSILDATSGNAGIAYAMIGAAMGYRVTLCLPANASAERKRILGIYGARIIETDPAQGSDPGHGLAGLKHMATAIVPGIYDPALADAQVTVSTAECQAMARRLALEEGLLVGPSSGASVSAALRLARTLPEGAVVVTVLFDSGSRYLADPFWED